MTKPEKLIRNLYSGLLVGGWALFVGWVAFPALKVDPVTKDSIANKQEHDFSEQLIAVNENPSVNDSLNGSNTQNKIPENNEENSNLNRQKPLPEHKLPEQKELSEPVIPEEKKDLPETKLPKAQEPHEPGTPETRRKSSLIVLGHVQQKDHFKSKWIVMEGSLKDILVELELQSRTNLNAIREVNFLERVLPFNVESTFDLKTSNETH